MKIKGRKFFRWVGNVMVVCYVEPKKGKTFKIRSVELGDFLSLTNPKRH